MLVGGVAALLLLGILVAVFLSGGKGGHDLFSNGTGGSTDNSYLPAVSLDDGGSPSAEDREAASQAMQYWKMFCFFTPGDNELTVRNRNLREAYQYREPRILIHRQSLTDVDKLNSVDWNGSVQLTGKGIRKGQGDGYFSDLSQCAWSEWGPPDSVPARPAMVIQRRAGRWEGLKNATDWQPVLKRDFSDLREAMRLFREASSKTNISNIGKALAVYTGSYNDKWPPDLGYLVRDNWSPGLFVSPYSNRPPLTLVNKELIGETDYIYIPLDSQADSGLIEVYERPENTEGKKILVLYHDWHVGEFTDVAAFKELLKKSMDYAKSKSNR